MFLSERVLLLRRGEDEAGERSPGSLDELRCRPRHADGCSHERRRSVPRVFVLVVDGRRQGVVVRRVVERSPARETGHLLGRRSDVRHRVVQVVDRLAGVGQRGDRHELYLGPHRVRDVRSVVDSRTCEVDARRRLVDRTRLRVDVGHHW